MDSLIDVRLEAAPLAPGLRRPAGSAPTTLRLMFAIIVVTIATVLVADVLGLCLAPSPVFVAVQTAGWL